jgi:plasmid stabilization system protein ParE
VTRRVVLVEEAERQLNSVDRWWLTHRQAAPDLFLDELDQAIELLSELPDIGSPFRRANRPGVRRLLLRRSKYWVYYFHDQRRSIVYILALWSTYRGSDPTLPEPVLR